MTEATEESKLRVALSLAESLRTKKNALAFALAESASDFHKAMKHKASDWRGCSEAECKRAWAATLTNGAK